MAVTGKRGVGIPTILLHDGEGTIVSIEMKTGETYRGLLDETEDNMNCVMKDAVRTDINGNTSHVEQVYLRGSQILFIVFPDIYPLQPDIAICIVVGWISLFIAALQCTRRCSNESRCGRNTRARYRRWVKEELEVARREDKLQRSSGRLKNGEVDSETCATSGSCSQASPGTQVGAFEAIERKTTAASRLRYGR
ncbi:hypothetical protein PC129_g16444 [Phytophthora cactorum]|uniref:Small nuclear ribonucleoprotein Sm D3 n=1 Tax=Phytophthora cactorum TaxID=29920 RepID=A0A8T1HMW6_9STRA|nr:hypothetical protein Pcac1_g28420 [Phytophthora cactorum]KAG2997358.1 hypothetical protein PC118_g1952 [Phytophthora cactorum]KAG3048564.1 hypothetical protein PC121_g19414 [Phytophthora cactorum]KAG3212612.1 hypothetical protein PC129_g16444 [Phytophthora cactorum]KAG4248412.1 hypothetical protein PC116_g3805 [Phytophthora cactorum]